MSFKALCLFVFLGVAATTTLATEPPAPAPSGEAPKPGGDVPDKFKNLKVLPADISKKDLLAVMKSMNQGLGVKCNFCHQAEPTRDFAVDTDHKNAARGMMKLTNRLNSDTFNWKDAPKATCYMCHHGEEKPVLVPPQPPPAGLTVPPGAPQVPAPAPPPKG